MLRKITVLVVCAVMLFSACAVNIGEDGLNGSPAGTELTDDAEASSPQSVLEHTPVPTPSPTPFPDELVEANNDYAFICSEESQLMFLPDEMSPVLEELPSETSVEITGVYDEWFRVEANGVVGFVRQDDTGVAEGYIIADEVNLREGPGRNYDIITKTQANTEITVLETNDEWIRVLIKSGDEGGTVGYMHFEYVSYTDGYIVKQGVNMRSGPDLTFEIVDKLDAGKRVSVLFKYGEWYKVETNNNIGYIHEDFLQEAPIVVKLDESTAYITASEVNLREGPAVGFAIVMKLYKFTRVTIIGENEEWYKVECDDTTGYVSKDFVAEGVPTVYVVSQDVNLRAEANTGSDILTKVRQNSEFKIIFSDGNWYFGETNGNRGFIRGDYLDNKPVGDGQVKREFTDDEVFLAAKVAYLEAKGTGYDGYAAVVNVLYNRTKSRMFSNDITEVIFQRNQFTVTNHSNFGSLTPSDAALRAARDVLNGGKRPMPLNVTFFFAKYLGTSWGNDKVFYKTVGNNNFFRYVG